jgi:hypothetical protein
MARPHFAGFKPSRSRGLLATTNYQPFRVNPADNAEPANQMMGHQAPGLILFVSVLWDTLASAICHCFIPLAVLDSVTRWMNRCLYSSSVSGSAMRTECPKDITLSNAILCSQRTNY